MNLGKNKAEKKNPNNQEQATTVPSPPKKTTNKQKTNRVRTQQMQFPYPHRNTDWNFFFHTNMTLVAGFKNKVDLQSTLIPVSKDMLDLHTWTQVMKKPCTPIPPPVGPLKVCYLKSIHVGKKYSSANSVVFYQHTDQWSMINREMFFVVNKLINTFA